MANEYEFDRFILIFYIKMGNFKLKVENRAHLRFFKGTKLGKYINIVNPKKKLVGGAPQHVKRAETPLSTSFFLGLKCFILLEWDLPLEGNQFE